MHKHRIRMAVWVLVPVLAGCGDAARPTGSQPLAVNFELENGASTDCSLGVTWLVNGGHLVGPGTTSRFTSPTTCWEYAGSGGVTVNAQYAFQAGLHPAGENRLWYSYALDNNGTATGETLVLDAGTGDPGVVYTDALPPVAFPAGAKGMLIGLRLPQGSLDPYDMGVEVWTKLSAPFSLTGQLPNGTTAALAWSNAETGSAVTTEIWSSLNGAGFQKRDSVASGVGTYSATGLASGSTYRFYVRHRAPTDNVVRLSDSSNVVTLTTPPPPPPSFSVQVVGAWAIPGPQNNTIRPTQTC